jgi:hypothetical protein
VLIQAPLPSTSCPPQPAIPAYALASDAAFAGWLNGEAGRQWIADGRKAGWECYDKLAAIGRLRK